MALVKLREIDFYNNVIRFYRITAASNQGIIFKHLAL